MRQREVRGAVDRLGAWVAGLRWADVPAGPRDRLGLVLLDVLGVTALGAREPEQRRLVAAWTPASGPAPIVGAGCTTTVEAAAWLNATALVRLELDEGHKRAKGHPAAHAFPAVLALAAERDASGPDTLAALLAAYEVAARFGRATRLRPGTHPHGNWGVAGAAAGCARLLGLDAEATAAAIDAGSGLPIAGHFTSALDGNRVREAWMGAANVSGLAAAGIARSTGTAAGSLGELLGEIDPAELDADLGSRWEVEGGYVKRHASCSFTHAAVDAALELRDRVDGETVEEVLVETHSLAAGLDRRTWTGPLAAMFSVPFTVATALRRGRLDPAALSAGALADPATAALAARVTVRAAPDLDARLPAERPARVTVRSVAGTVTAEAPNPVGDADHHPFTAATLPALLADLLSGRGPVDTIQAVCAALPDLAGIGDALRGLAHLKEDPCASTP
ncbi:MmgE/PrpD family protein [Pseudonocardia sp. RS11V-5]|uniref:MmgE/PrpD family protein n=1 Tax=Pseudonocardia terrae TaxID=2905831 RepID=UPI001E612719|nr:MmgE/PrpD family protein [Pseudonocardia terrae]MCE3552246.1 MmgE/PrpD family protein [Pseudonocardia terrae]